MMDLNNALIETYGTQIADDIEMIKKKIDVVIAAHLFAGNLGDTPLCVLNRTLQDIMNK